MKFKTIVYITFLSFFLLGSCQSQTQKKESKKETEEKIEVSTSIEKTYKLTGFKQSCCTGIVNYSLQEVDGFIKSKADVKNQRLTIWFNPKKCTETDIKKAINKTPYKIENSL